jgi:hypothetical protein
VKGRQRLRKAGESPSHPARPIGPKGRERMAKALPPAAHRPFLDALAEVLASWVVSRITGGSGPRTTRKSEAGNTEAFDGDSTAIRAEDEGDSIGR